MAEEVTKVEPVDASKTTPETTVEKTVSEIINDTVPASKKPEDSEEAGETVPISTFVKVKKDAKKFEKLYNDLKNRAESGESPEDISDDLDELASEFNVEPKFVKKLANILKGQAEKKVGESMAPIIEQNKKLTDREKAKLIDDAFNTAFASAMETMPEYAEVADKEAIKALSLLPANANKTFAQLIEQTYGKAISGKKTIDSTTPGGGKDPEPIDYARAKQDTEYFKEIMADPALKKEYNANMLKSKHQRPA